MSKGLRNAGIKVGAVNHKDDVEMADWLDDQMRRIDAKKTRTVFLFGYADMGLNCWEVVGRGYTKQEAKDNLEKNLKRFHEDHPYYENRVPGSYVESSFEESEE